MNELDDQYEDSSELGEYPLPGPLESGPRDTSERPTGSDFQRLVHQAIDESEFIDSWSHGIPLRRGGKQLRISYDDAVRMVWDEPQRL